MEKINIVLLDEFSQMPYRGSNDAAGWDIYANLLRAYRDDIVLAPGQVQKIPTGLAIELPKGTFGAIYPRSGMATNRGLALSNAVAVIDADYRGEIFIPIKNTSDEVQKITHGERIAQLIIQPFIPVEFNAVDTISTTSRDTGGFGSTGDK